MSDETFVQERPRNPFNASQEVTTRPVATLGALASTEQQRALGELQAQLMLARMNPRDPQTAVEAILRDCSRVSLAKDALYQYARGGTDISGPSIKLMEAIARRWGNLNSGFKVIHTEGNTSEVIAYGWDLESGFRDERQFQVRHIRDTRKGPVPVTDERDVYELIANMAQRRKRACLMAIIPADVIEAAVEQCNETLSANVDTSVEGLKKMLRAFAEFGVTQAQIEQKIQCRLEAIQPGQMTQLSKIYSSLKDGIAKPSDHFRAADPPRQTRQQPPQTPATPPTKPASDADAVAVPPSTGPDHRAPHADNLGLMDKPDAATETEFENSFEHVVLDALGVPTDGEVHLDPLTWAQAFMAVWNNADEHTYPALLVHNADALHDCSELSPEADALLDGVIPLPPPDEPVAVTEPEVSEDERITAQLLQTLGTLKTFDEAKAFANSAAVSTPVNRWRAEGQTGRVDSVRAAFQARMDNLKKAESGG